MPDGDLHVPHARPTDPTDLADRLHDVLVRLNVAWFVVVSAERAYERTRADVINHHIATGESPSTAERLARVDTTVLDRHTNLVDARMDVTRLEAFAAHYRFLIAHAPPPAS